MGKVLAFRLTIAPQNMGFTLGWSFEAELHVLRTSPPRARPLRMLLGHTSLRRAFLAADERLGY